MSVVAARLECSPANVYRLIGQGDLACVRLGASKGYRVPESAVEELLGAVGAVREPPLRVRRENPQD